MPPLTRRAFLARATALTAAASLPTTLRAQLPVSPVLDPLSVAAAGSFRAMLEGPLRTLAAGQLHLALTPHTQGADAVAHSLISGALLADLFISITASPLTQVMQAGRATIAYPIARTELVLIYSPKSRFFPQFEQIRRGQADLWQFLQTPVPGKALRIARSNPAQDPSGRAILFALMLAAKKLNQPTLVDKILGPPMNPAQVVAGGNTRQRFDSGEIDLMAAYRSAVPDAAPATQPFLPLPADINLSSLNLRAENPELSLALEGKTFLPEPLIFYAATLTNAPNPKAAEDFLTLLRAPETQRLLREHHFAPPDPATPIHATDS